MVSFAQRKEKKKESSLKIGNLVKGFEYGDIRRDVRGLQTVVDLSCCNDKFSLEYLRHLWSLPRLC